MILNILQIVFAGLLVAAILLQNKGTELGAAFGGGGDVIRRTKRGAEKFLFWATVVFAVIFFGLVAAGIFI